MLLLTLRGWEPRQGWVPCAQTSEQHPNTVLPFTQQGLSSSLQPGSALQELGLLIYLLLPRTCSTKGPLAQWVHAQGTRN